MRLRLDALDDMRRVAVPSSHRAIWPRRDFSGANRPRASIGFLAIDEVSSFRYNEDTPPVVGLLYTVSFAPLYTTAVGYFLPSSLVSPPAPSARFPTRLPSRCDKIRASGAHRCLHGCIRGWS